MYGCDVDERNAYERIVHILMVSNALDQFEEGAFDLDVPFVSEFACI